MAAICFVLDELHPFTSGGIGRLAYNILQRETSRGVHDFHVLLPTRRAVDPARFLEVFGPRVRLHRVSLQPRFAQRVRMARRNKDTLLKRFSRTLVESYAILEALEGMPRMDLIEFADYHGWGVATLSHREILGRPRVAVRLHAGLGFLMEIEGERPAGDDLLLIELEKRAVQQADIVVGHVPRATRKMLDYYFASERVAPTVVTEMPPVVWPRPEARPRVPRHDAPDFLFLSKIQPVKNPQLFVDGCAAFFDRHPEYPGRAIVACHAFKTAYRDEIVARVPERWRHKFEFRAPLTGDAWRERVAGAVVVIPSHFESLNLLAYEAFFAGAIVCVNRGCAAFGDDAPLSDGQHCLKFDPTPSSLAETLERAVQQNVTPQSELPPPPDVPYWG